MSKLIPMDEAAAMLGMTVDRVSELRSSNEIFGYRDGSTWKFKRSELERVAGELGITLGAVAEAAEDAVKSKIDDAVSELGLALEDSSDDLVLQEPDSVEYMEDSSVELFASGLGESDLSSDSIKVTDSSLKIDDLKLLDEDDDDSLKLDDDSLIAGVVDDDQPAPSGDSPQSKDSIDLSSSSIFDDEEALSFGSSSLKLSTDAAGDDAADLLDDEPIGGESGSGTGKDIGASGGDDLLLASGSDMFGDELSLEDSVSFDDSADLSSVGDAALDDSDSNVELKLESNESGINLAASESGISLSTDEPLDLGASDIDALQLDDDDEDLIVVEEMAGPDEPTLMQEDDFNLTPLEEKAATNDSTSQVIAMEDSGVFTDESEGASLGSGDFGAEIVEDAGFDDAGGFGDDALGVEDGLYDDAAMAGAAVAARPDVEYSNWQLASLGLVAFTLLAGSLVAYDLARNMWMPDNQTIGNGVLKFFLGLVGMD